MDGVMAKFRKKPVVIEAVQLTWANWSEICDFVDVGRLVDGKPEGTWIDINGEPTDEPQHHRNEDTLGLLIPTLEGLMVGRENDWIIKGVQGELYPCKPDIFEETYQMVNPPDQGFVDPY
jgi:hypothetical protein